MELTFGWDDKKAQANLKKHGVSLKPDMFPEYDFSKGKRGKYAVRYTRGTNIVRLDPDVAAMFPNSKAVNKALRLAGELSKIPAKRKIAR